jgi:DNA polymerase I-like protein with 3'-5' exonuclease and polymerase domains
MEIIVTDDLDEVQAYLAQSNSFTIADIETTSLVVANGQLVCIGFAPYDRDDILVWWPQTKADLSRLVIKRMVAHNSPFEEKWLKSYGCRVRTIWDTMFMAHLLDENHPIGLDDLGQRLLGYGKEEIDVTVFGEWFGQHWEDRERVRKADPKLWRKRKEQVTVYVAKDVHITRELLKWQRSHIRKNLKPHEDPIRVMRELMIPAIMPIRQMEDNRLPVRIGMVRKTRDHVEGQIAAIEKTLDASIPPKEEWPDWLQKTKPKWGATNWTKWWLYEYQGALVPKRNKPTKTWPEGNPGLSQEDMGKIDHPAARMLSDRSTLYKQLTGFLVPIETRTRDGRISTSFNLTGTVTGRLSSSSPKGDPGLNSQQIPRDKATRNLFGERGMAWIEADFSQLELRIAAVLSGDRTMIELFEAGEDIHTYMARRVVRQQEVTKEHRTLAKGVNFGFLYGMRANHFTNYVRTEYGVTITKKESEAFREEYFTTFSGLEPWYRKQRKEAIEYGGVHNEFGRFRHLPRVYHEDFWIQENAFRQAINSPVQSTGSDFMLLSLARLARDLRLRELGAKLVVTVHDSVGLLAPYKTAMRAGRIVKETMELADDTLDRRFFLKADVTISRCWGGEPLASF